LTEQGSIASLTPAHFDKVFSLNAEGPVFLVQKLLPMMTRAGSIILVSSAMHVMGIPGHTAYAATKAALRSYARSWAAKFKDHGIRVNTLSPASLTLQCLILNRQDWESASLWWTCISA
jgi:NAD(P)-dependent dehydrogenase (short-subunit alcohol dehydrogenase family)